MKVFVRIKSLKKQRSSELTPYELPEGIGTVRGLIAAFVHAEVERFNDKDTELPLLALMSAFSAPKIWIVDPGILAKDIKEPA